MEELEDSGEDASDVVRLGQSQVPTEGVGQGVCFLLIHSRSKTFS